jgi:hypothetical protein
MGSFFLCVFINTLSLGAVDFMFIRYCVCALTLILLMWRIGRANSNPIYIQQDATLHSLFISRNYTFRVVLSPIIRSAYTCIYSIWYLSHRYSYLPLSWKSWNRFECAVGGVSMEQHGVYWTKLHKILHWGIFRKSVVKIQV